MFLLVDIKLISNYCVELIGIEDGEVKTRGPCYFGCKILISTPIPTTAIDELTNQLSTALMDKVTISFVTGYKGWSNVTQEFFLIHLNRISNLIQSIEIIKRWKEGIQFYDCGYDIDDPIHNFMSYWNICIFDFIDNDGDQYKKIKTIDYDELSILWPNHNLKAIIADCDLFKILPREIKDNKYITRSTKITMSITWKTQRLIRLYGIIYHYYFIINGPSNNNRTSIPITGGYVLYPTPQLYRQPLGIFDFKSLYPSIIARHNICPSTVVVTGNEDGDGNGGGNGDGDGIWKAPNGQQFLQSPIGLIPKIMYMLLERRKETGLSLYKLYANSIFGQMGMKGGRLYYPLIADAIASAGRYYIQTTIGAIKQPVIYADTDSAMVLISSLDQFKKLHHYLNEELMIDGKQFIQPPMQIGMQSCHSSALFLSKKNYCLVEENKVIIKGCSFIHSDCIHYIKDVGISFLHMLLVEKQSIEQLEAFRLERLERIGEQPLRLIQTHHIKSEKSGLLKKLQNVKLGDVVSYLCLINKELILQQDYSPSIHIIDINYYRNAFINAFRPFFDILNGSTVTGTSTATTHANKRQKRTITATTKKTTRRLIPLSNGRRQVFNLKKYNNDHATTIQRQRNDHAIT